MTQLLSKTKCSPDCCSLSSHWNWTPHQQKYISICPIQNIYHRPVRLYEGSNHSSLSGQLKEVIILPYITANFLLLKVEAQFRITDHDTQYCQFGLSSGLYFGAHHLISVGGERELAWKVFLNFTQQTSKKKYPWRPHI